MGERHADIMDPLSPYAAEPERKPGKPRRVPAVLGECVGGDVVRVCMEDGSWVNALVSFHSRGDTNVYISEVYRDAEMLEKSACRIWLSDSLIVDPVTLR